MLSGRCLCNHVRYEFDEKTAVVQLHCHCKDCQRVTGSGKATVILFPTDAVQIRGEYKTYSTEGSEGSKVNRGFCAICGSQMFTFVDEIPGHVFIKAGGMDDTDWVDVDITCWGGSARQWLPADKSTSISEKNPPLPVEWSK